MAIVDYATLQTSVANWLARADLGSVIPDFIQLGESRINRDLRVRRMQARVAGTAAAGLIPIPDDYTGALSLKVTFAGGQYEIFPLTEVNEPVYPVGSGLPLGYTVVNGNIELAGGQQDIPYSLVYWTKVPSLSASNQQTWLLTEEPGIYLYAALVEASPYTRDDERTVLWATQYKAIIDRLAAGDEYERYGNAPSQTLKGATP
ncbi:hypothetical protein ORG27_12185 [Stenotrophomonas lactitubi]|uniref:phage adaptor protein n=1 Tax=Stenotrophomonas lactitubi TaxID=2045214 RepID=UPI0022494C89|nr:hypothetical protein [Stenotrophomonas lactitubi]MCX2894335.1 hypothetical protein [Stenotrophomonas lactitubi]